MVGIWALVTYLCLLNLLEPFPLKMESCSRPTFQCGIHDGLLRLQSPNGILSLLSPVASQQLLLYRGILSQNRALVSSKLLWVHSVTLLLGLDRGPIQLICHTYFEYHWICQVARPTGQQLLLQLELAAKPSPALHPTHTIQPYE